MEKMVELIKVSKSFKQEKILKGITHSFEKGKIHGIMGFNGSGKTVMFKCICGLLCPEEGQIHVAGKQIGVDADFPESLGMIIENPGFLPNLSGVTNLKRLAKIRGNITEEDIRSSMLRVGLDPSLKKAVRQYSLGMRERLGIAQAIMEDPKLLVLDEPFNGLDKRSVEAVYELLEELRDRGKTILLVAHNIPEIQWLCDTICEMDAGVLTRIK